MSTQDKKIPEHYVLCDFQNSKHQKYKFRILQENESKNIYTAFNTENPDFIIEYRNDFIGIELTQLISNNNQDVKEKTGKINLAHYYNTKKFNQPSKFLLQNDELFDVFMEAYHRKQMKRKNYVTPITWFLAHANQPYNRNLIKYAREDNILEAIVIKIRNELNNDLSFDKLFMFTSQDDYICEIR